MGREDTRVIFWILGAGILLAAVISVASIALREDYSVPTYVAETEVDAQNDVHIAEVNRSLQESIEAEILQSINTGDELSAYTENLVSGNSPPDGIPPIDQPQFVSVEQADTFLVAEEPVFIVTVNGETKIYPQQILVWHEVVNDSVGGKNVSVSYSPLTGTVVGYQSQSDEVSTDFGTSGYILNSNIVLYDRETGSLWPQIFGTAITGEARGSGVEMFPVAWSSWGDAKAAYPDAEVLSKNTGHVRSYGFDPYGSYIGEGTYYDSGRVFFPLMHEDDRLSPKEVVVGVKGSGQVAVLKEKIRQDGAVHSVVGKVPIVAFWDDVLNTARIYSRDLDGEVLEFVQSGQNFVDQNGDTWASDGTQRGGESELNWIPSFDSMWFAWSAFYPDSGLIE